jgi:hypothetical protein
MSRKRASRPAEIIVTKVAFTGVPVRALTLACKGRSNKEGGV